MTSSLASERDLSVVEFVQRFTQASSKQVQSLYFSDLTSDGQRVVANRTLRRLCKWGYLVRIPQREIGASGGGSSGYVYTVPKAKLQIDRHALAITELYIRLHKYEGLKIFNPEAHAYQSICDIELQPDAEILINTPTCPEGENNWWFIELDRATQAKGRILDKVTRYQRAYDPEHRDFDGFPRVLFVIDHPRGEQRAFQRIMEIGRWIGDTQPELFMLCTMADAETVLTK